MKKINLILLFVGILGMSVMTSCTPDEPTDVLPTLGFVSEASSITADATVAVNAPLLFKVTANQNPETKKALQSLRVQSFVDNTAVKDTTVTINDDNYLGSFNYNATSTAPYLDEKFTFTLTDKAGEIVIKSINITTTPPVTATAFGTEVSDAFFHIGGSLEGAYDLVTEAVVASTGTDSSKDLVNTDVAGATFTGSWTAGTGNNSMFVKDNSFDYASGSVEDATTAYTNGTASASVTNPAAGDIFIVKLRGGTDYAIINILTVDPTNNDCSCGNTGKITFNFKKS